MQHETLQLENDALKFPPQLRCLLIGPSQSGKTTFIKSVIRYRQYLFVKSPDLILYVSPNLGETYLSHEAEFINEMKQLAGETPIHFLGKLPSVEELMSYVHRPNFKVLYIIDDYHQAMFDDDNIAQCFIRLSSHNGIDVIATAHSAFSNGKFYSLIFRNSNCIILYRCLSDKSTDQLLARKCFPGRPTFIREAFDQVMSHCGPHTPLVFQFNIGNLLNHRFPIKSRILPYSDRQGRLRLLPIYFGWKGSH